MQPCLLLLFPLDFLLQVVLSTLHATCNLQLLVRESHINCSCIFIAIVLPSHSVVCIQVNTGVEMFYVASVLLCVVHINSVVR